MVGLAFASLQVVTAEALPSTGVSEESITGPKDLVTCTEFDKDREACRGDMAKETLRSKAGKDINAGSVDSEVAKMQEKGSGKGEGEITDFSAELECIEGDLREACTTALGSMGGASTGEMGSSPVRP